VPYIECHIATGLTKARKTQLIRDIVKVTHESVGSDPKIINVLLFEHPADNMSISGRIHGEEAPKQIVERHELEPGQSSAPSAAQTT
jgi:4-oxalocrotonate tautomerase family enzyme